jgi:hypothetical protein
MQTFCNVIHVYLRATAQSETSILVHFPGLQGPNIGVTRLKLIRVLCCFVSKVPNISEKKLRVEEYNVE